MGSLVQSLNSSSPGSGNVLADGVYYPASYYEGPVAVEQLSVEGNLDGFKIRTSANRTSFDDWYFEAFSKTSNASISVVFYNTGEFKDSDNPLSVVLFGTFEDGTKFLGRNQATQGASVFSNESGIWGDWMGAGGRFTVSTLDLPNTEALIKLNTKGLDAPDINFRGTVHLKSRAPSHYPCNPNVEGVNTLLLPSLHWSNAIPDADATVKLKINGKKLEITSGIGYQDKLWGDAPVLTSPKYSDWGHAQFGPYSVVWYDLLDYKNQEHAYGYVAKNGKFLEIDCAPNAVQVRQVGPKATWPPTVGVPQANGVTARFDIGGGLYLVVNVTKEEIVREQPYYALALGSVVGGIEGQKTYTGRSMYGELVYGLQRPK